MPRPSSLCPGVPSLATFAGFHGAHACSSSRVSVTRPTTDCLVISLNMVKSNTRAELSLHDYLWDGCSFVERFRQLVRRLRSLERELAVSAAPDAYRNVFAVIAGHCARSRQLTVSL